MKLNWVKTVFSNGRHNLCVGNFVRWRDAYHICFVDAHHHGALDGQLRVISSADLETWDTCVAMAATSFDPQLLPLGDRMLIYGVQGDWEGDDFAGYPSREVVAETRDLQTWSEPRRCFVANHDFWTPIELDGRYYLTCDDCGHVPEGMSGTVDLLTSTDGERWHWVSEVVRGSQEYSRIPSETALCALPDGRLLAVVRTKLPRAVLATARPPYVEWERTIIPHALQGAAPARVGDRVVIAGRAADESGEPRTALFEYRDGALELGLYLPSGRDTGYSGLYAVDGNEVLIAYYSATSIPIRTSGSRTAPATSTWRRCRFKLRATDPVSWPIRPQFAGGLLHV